MSSVILQKGQCTLVSAFIDHLRNLSMMAPGDWPCSLNQFFSRSRDILSFPGGSFVVLGGIVAIYRVLS